LRNLILVAAAASLTATACLAAPAPERLAITPVPGWVRITNQQSADGWDHEHVPKGQTAANFTQIITDQGYMALPHADPAAFLRARFANIANACTGAAVNGPKTAVEAGVPVAYGQFYCG
jgi:hypothetical protein